MRHSPLPPTPLPFYTQLSALKKCRPPWVLTRFYQFLTGFPKKWRRFHKFLSKTVNFVPLFTKKHYNIGSGKRKTTKNIEKR